MTDVESRSDFVAGAAGALFRVRSWPAGAESGGHAVLLVPPFAEEMNRSRRFLAALRRECARRGARAVLVDPFGTGDSAGELDEASWEIWVDDLAACAEGLRADGVERLSLLGVRAGSLLVEALSERLRTPPRCVVHVQPESDGASVVRRLLSARVLAERFAGRRDASVAALEARLAAGECLELGGYRIGAALLGALREAKLEPSATRHAATRMHRFELLEPPSPAAESDGSHPTWQRHVVPTRPFWQLAESVPEPRVVARVAEALVP